MTGRTAMRACAGALAALVAAAIPAGPTGGALAAASQPPTREQAIQETLAAIRQELQAHGGAWDKWAAALQPYRDDIRGCITNWQTFKWPWPAKKGYVFQGAAIQVHLRDDLEDLPEGERPLEAILHFDRQLRALGTDLLVALIPSKLSIHPDYLYAAVENEPQRPARAPEDRQVSVAVKRLMARLLEGGVEVVDLEAAFRQFRLQHGDDVPLFYQRDGHFINRGARLAAEKIAERLRRYDFVQAALAAGNPYVGEKGSRDDGAKADDDLLLIKDKRTGDFYKEARDSPVLVAGDSHLLYNDSRAAVTAQIAHQIGMPVSRMGREGLSREVPVQVAKDPLLPRRRVIVLLYSERMLAPRAGRSKWPVVNLPGADAATRAPAPAPAGQVEDLPATGVVVEACPPPDTKALYRHYLIKFYLKDLADAAGRPVGAGDGIVYVLAMYDRKVLPVAAAAPGQKLSVRLTSWALVQTRYGAIQTGILPTVKLELEKPLYWAEVPGQPRLSDDEIKRIGEEAAPADPPGPPTHPASEGPASWFWPLALDLPPSITPDARAAGRLEKGRAEGKWPILVWTPPEAKRIRAILLISPNTDSMSFAAHKPVREVCTRRQVGIVYLRFCPHTGLMEKVPDDRRQAALETDRRNLQAILDKVAEKSGIAEYRYAPWIPLGKSSCGRFPMNLAWLYPERTIAAITWHGEVPHWPPPAWAKVGDQTILTINVNGQDEWSGTWYRHVRPNLLNYRLHTNWLPHQVVSWGVGHGNYPDETSGRGDPTPRMMRATVWDYMALWLDKVLELRLPEDGYPTEAPVRLRQVDADGGCLIHPRAIEELLGTKWFAFREARGTYRQIPWPDEVHPVYDTVQGKTDPQWLVRRASDVPQAERRKRLWVPDRQAAEAWFKLHAVKGQAFGIP